jgi:uncharacterized protein YceK
MTVYTQAAYFEDGQVDVEGWPCGSVYAGTAGDIFLIRGGYCSCSGGPGPGDGALDLPLSLAADTALLPLTIAETIVMARRRRDAGKRDMDTEELRREAEREMEALRRRKEGGDAE